MISVVWVLSFAISCPLLFGLNNTGKQVLTSTLVHYAQYFSWVKKHIFNVECNDIWGGSTTPLTNTMHRLLNHRLLILEAPQQPIKHENCGRHLFMADLRSQQAITATRYKQATLSLWMLFVFFLSF